MKRWLVTLLLAAALPVTFASEPLGTVLAPFTLEDQSGRSRTLDESVRRIVTTADRTGAALVETALNDISGAQLDARQTILVADISEAPRFIRPLIRSGMKKRAYDHWIDSRGATRELLPFTADAVTLIELEQLRITAVHRYTDAAQLRAALVPDAAPTP